MNLLLVLGVAFAGILVGFVMGCIYTTYAMFDKWINS